MSVWSPVAAFGVTAGSLLLVPRFLPSKLRRWCLVIAALAFAAIFFWVVAAEEGHLTVGWVIALSAAGLINGLSLRVCGECGRIALVGNAFPKFPKECKYCGAALVGIASRAPKVPGAGPGT